LSREARKIQQSRLRKDFVTHDFDKLLDLAGLDLDEAGKDFLRRLGDAVVWVGKYPVSIDADRMQRLTLQTPLESIREGASDRDAALSRKTSGRSQWLKLSSAPRAVVRAA
jgi:hypothetical protein